ncbi:membrane anchor subunit of succinate dehydrogenase, Sdh4 [Lobosporangium transversale]|uniref:Succinate dehydrogenase [ubiquinone] cytochrome b small subunit n=1 Tax=Lobosporangium transversale TaxID=64571 RepID=A0A1Y2GPD4_9FUNG|nr:CybS-domain-containing protein [Lobosporangium transversale]KAF9899656.1 membrane anchor subunit of succinate dehydrogenase, Sdh4 [Lobosporangium transversale]ORZ17551.1 CybS-domain-containing protein [Lobosporangium transversale]|eukprot:XP_021881938.1 CybS-domain-containing protein [Lobosporangium transversale]
MALRLATSPLAMSRSSPAIRLATSLRSSTSLNGRIYFHASRSAAAAAPEQTPPDVTEVYKPTAFKIPPPNSVHGSKHWDFERLLSASLVPLFAVSAINGAHPITDGLLGVVVPIHSHIGFDAMITDYLHPGKVGVFANKAISWTLRGATLLVLVGCYQFNASDVGLTELVKRAWTA